MGTPVKVIRGRNLKRENTVRIVLVQDDHFVTPAASPDTDIAAPTEQELAAFTTALEEIESTTRRVLQQAERNTAHLRAARLESQTALSIITASNEMAQMSDGNAL